MAARQTKDENMEPIVANSAQRLIFQESRIGLSFFESFSLLLGVKKFLAVL
jgi:hypothetical protein